MVHMLQGSTFLHRLQPQRLRYRQALLRNGIENVGSRVLDKAYFNHDLTIRTSQLEAFSKMLENDKSLKSLRVEDSNTLWQAMTQRQGLSQGIKALLEALKVNTSLKVIILSRNSIDDEGAKAIGEALKVNTSLTEIDLHAQSHS